MERPEQASRHSFEPGVESSDSSFGLSRFSATANVSRPGRSPARSVSFMRFTAGLLPALVGVACCSAAAATQVMATQAAASARLAQIQNFIEPRFKVFFSLGPQTEAIHGQSFLHGAHPAHEFLNILSRFLLIFA